MAGEQVCKNRELPMNRVYCREVLECGDGVGEVTALASRKTPELAADMATPTQSGDSEDSVAAVQDAGAWFMAPLRGPAARS